MASQLEISIQTNKDFNELRNAHDLISSWCDYEPPFLRPEFFSSGEPVTQPLTGDQIHAAARLWHIDHSLLLRRATEPQLLADITHTYGKYRFFWLCTVWIDKSAGGTAAEALFQFLITKFEAGFAFVSTKEDVTAKHLVKYKRRLGSAEVSAEEFRGIQITDKLPGLYWRTYFGPEYCWLWRQIASAFGREGCPAQRFYKGLLVEPYKDVSIIGSDRAEATERMLMTSIGERLFFTRASNQG